MGWTWAEMEIFCRIRFVGHEQRLSITAQNNSLGKRTFDYYYFLIIAKYNYKFNWGNSKPVYSSHFTGVYCKMINKLVCIKYLLLKWVNSFIRSYNLFYIYPNIHSFGILATSLRILSTALRSFIISPSSRSCLDSKKNCMSFAAFLEPCDKLFSRIEAKFH